jgi:hypothetical protein
MRRGLGRRVHGSVRPALAIAVLFALSSAQAQPAAGARRTDEPASGYRVVISLADRMLWVLRDADTVRAASAGVGSDAPLEFDGQRWEFDTPRGRRVVIGKTENAPWVPPDWHYAETARAYGLRLARLRPGRLIRLHDGRGLVIRDSMVEVIEPDGAFAELPTDEEIVFDGTLYIPPLNSKNRHVPGQLGRYQLDLGGGYMLHGTPDQASIGTATTHGCIRLRDEDIAWLYDNLPVGTGVYIH